MSELTADLERATAEVASLELQLDRLAARLAGKRAEVAQLSESIAREQSTGLPTSRTDAIVAVLRQRVTAMSPSEITEALNDAGRTDELSSVTATLAHLLKSRRVTRQGRGRYVAG